jgi:hemerythrin-like domain-containing protein
MSQSTQSTQSQQDVVDILTTDHREALELIAQIYSTDHPDAKRDLANQVTAELMRHAVAEEMYVYPVMSEELPDGKRIVEHDTGEHKDLEREMKELEGIPAVRAEFEQQVRALEATLRDHVRDEETKQFPQLRAQLSHDKLVSMGSRVEAAKHLAPTRPHPGSPNNELFHKTVGAGVGMVDRLRDALTGRKTG